MYHCRFYTERQKYAGRSFEDGTDMVRRHQWFALQDKGDLSAKTSVGESEEEQIQDRLEGWLKDAEVC